MVSGVILPIFIILLIEIFYVSVILHIPVRDSSVLYLELPLMGIFCILINLIYLVLDFKNQPADYTNLTAGNTPAHPDYKTNFMVHSGNNTLIIPVSQVAYFIVLRKTNFLTTTDNKEYLYNDSLETLRKDYLRLIFSRLTGRFYCQSAIHRVFCTNKYPKTKHSAKSCPRRTGLCFKTESIGIHQLGKITARLGELIARSGNWD